MSYHKFSAFIFGSLKLAIPGFFPNLTPCWGFAFYSILITFSFAGCYKAPALHQKVYFGDKNGVQGLLKEGIDVNQTDRSGFTALHYATGLGETEILNTLLTNGANVNARGTLGETPLVFASDKCDKESMTILLEHGADPTLSFVSDEHNIIFTPLLFAANRGCGTAIIDLLLSSGLSVNYVEPSSGYTPLILAASGGNLATVEALVNAGANINHQDKDGISALITSSAKRFTDIVSYLLAKGADPNLSVGLDSDGSLTRGHLLEPGDTALSAAQRWGNWEVIDLLAPVTKKKVPQESQD